MLVLTRGQDDAIVLGDNVIITVLDIRGDKVRIGIEAPREMKILRKEIYEEVLKENRDAAKFEVKDLEGLQDLFNPPSTTKDEDEL
jgi:carbon storage regulator